MGSHAATCIRWRHAFAGERLPETVEIDFGFCHAFQPCDVSPSKLLHFSLSRKRHLRSSNSKFEKEPQQLVHDSSCDEERFADTSLNCACLLGAYANPRLASSSSNQQHLLTPRMVSADDEARCKLSRIA